MERKKDLRRLLQPDRLIWVLLLVLLVERLVLFAQFGPDYMSHSDDDAYIESGLYFIQNGTISMWGPHPSAMIMPGMPVVIGLAALVAPNLTSLRVILKLIWIGGGLLTAYFSYRTAALCSNGWGGLIAASGFLIPNMAWMDHVILTEAPYMLFFTLCIYLTLQMERSRDAKWAWGYLFSFMAGLMFRANMMTMPFFTFAWLFFRCRDERTLLLKRSAVLLAAFLLFAIPWGLRSLEHFGKFIPLSYGTGDPVLRGTYQGVGYPEDEELDLEENVTAVMRRDYAEYYRDEPQPYPEDADDPWIALYDPKGEVKDLDQAQYLSLEADSVKARYRLREWWARDPKGLLISYLFIKPRWMLNWSWAWEEAFHVPYEVLHRISQLNFILCVLGVGFSFLLRRARAPMVFLAGAYWICVYIHALAYVTDRYASTLIGLRFMIVGIAAAQAS